MAVFTSKTGRASVSLTRQNDTITVTAICDSLQRLIEYYESEIINKNSIIEQKDNEIKTAEFYEKKKTYNPFLAFILGIACGGLAVLIFFKQTSILDTILNFIKKLFK